MKTTKLYSEGVSGLEVKLNLMDQMAITDLHMKIYMYLSECEDLEAWWHMRGTVAHEELKKWEMAHPEPKISLGSTAREEIHGLQDMLKTVNIFLQKLILGPTEAATVFLPDEEESVETVEAKE